MNIEQIAKQEGFETEGGAVKMGTNVAGGAAAGTMIAPGVGTVIGAGMGLLGGFLGNKFNKDRGDESYERQKEALQNSVQWRVADAKKAGIHPLYALGQAPMQISPMAFEDRIGPSISEMGQNVAGAIARQVTPEEKARMGIEYQVAASQVSRNDAERDLFAAQAAKIHLENSAAMGAGTRSGLGVQSEDGQAPNPPGLGMINLKPAEVTSAKKGAAWSSAGINPTYQLRMIDKNLPMYMPIAEGDSPHETLNEMPYSQYAGLLMRNARIFGPGWMKDYVNSTYLGLEPTGKYDTKSYRK